MNDGERIIVDEIRKLQKLLAVTSLRDLNQRQKIELLATVGFSPREIAEFVGTTANTVSVALVKIRKLGRKSDSRKMMEGAEGEGS